MSRSDKGKSRRKNRFGVHSETRDYKRLWDKANPDKTRVYRRRKVLKAYGLTPTDYETMLTAQQGRCAICRRAPWYLGNAKGVVRRLDVDHNHATNKVRGLLCVRCNRALGWFESYTDRIQAYLGPDELRKIPKP